MRPCKRDCTPVWIVVIVGVITSICFVASLLAR